MRWLQIIWLASFCVGCLSATVSLAGPLTVAARESAEAVVRTFGKEAATGGIEKLAVRLESLATRYGDDALKAARRAGPRGVAAVESAGSRAPLVASLLSREGDRALWLVDDVRRLDLVAKYGDDATEALLKHKSLAEPLISQFDQVGAKALSQLDGQQARRLAMLAENGELAAIGQTPELLSVLSRYGDKGMDFVWRNKGALAATAALTAFLADPQPFIDGTRQLTQAVGEHVIEPSIATVAREIAPRIEWTWLALGVVAILAASGLLKFLMRQRLLPR